MRYQKCPVCDGTGQVSRAPWVAGDVPQWSDTGAAPYDCRTCCGAGIICEPLGMLPEPVGYRRHLVYLQQLVEQQANDEGLWFNAQHAPEAYLQQELRRLHAAIEGGPDVK